MKTKMYILVLLLLSFSAIIAQEIKYKNKNGDESAHNKTLEAIKLTAGEINFKDDEANTLMTITDEGIAGSVSLFNVERILSGNQLYNYSGNLFWQSNQLGTTNIAGGWTAADLNIYTSKLTDKVGIGTSNPVTKLEIFGTVRIAAVSNLPENTNRGLYIAGNYNDTDIGKIYVGDNTGRKFHFSTRKNNTDTDIMTIQDNGNIGVGTTNPNESALLELFSESKGLLLPRLSASELLSITNPAQGLVVYNSTQKVIAVFNGTKWVNSDGSDVAQKNFIKED